MEAGPDQTGTNVTTTWFDLIFAQPGAGKSVLLNSTNIACCLTPGMSSLPFVAIIDIGPSSAGMIVIKEAFTGKQTARGHVLPHADDAAVCREPV